MSDFEVLTPPNIVPDTAESKGLPPAVDTSKIPVPTKPEECIEFRGLNVDFLEEFVKINIDKNYYKTVSYPDFIQKLSSIVEPESPDVATGTQFWLPPNCMFFSTSKRDIRITCYFPEGVRKVKYHSSDVERVVPNILISMTLVKVTGDNYNVTDVRYMATKKSSQELRRKFYHPSAADGISLLPFTNVYNDGRLCYGSNMRISSVTLPDLRPLTWYYEMLFSSPFNDDLGVYALKPRSTYKSHPRDWFTYLATLAKSGKPFPYEELSVS